MVTSESEMSGPCSKPHCESLENLLTSKFYKIQSTIEDCSEVKEMSQWYMYPCCNHLLVNTHTNIFQFIRTYFFLFIGLVSVVQKG